MNLRKIMLESEIQDIDAWIKIAGGNSITDRITKMQFTWKFKNDRAYADFLRLLKKQKQEELALIKWHEEQQNKFMSKRGR